MGAGGEGTLAAESVPLGLVPAHGRAPAPGHKLSGSPVAKGPAASSEKDVLEILL